MKSIGLFSVFTLILLFKSYNLSSQDIITKKTGDDIISKVLEITNDEVKFKKWDNLEGPIFTLYKSDILLIRYKNGTKDIFSNDKSSISIENTSNSFVSRENSNLKNPLYENGVSSSTQDYNEGKKDAIRYYKGYMGASTGTLVTGLVTGSILSLVPALITSNTPSSQFNLNFPDNNKMKNQDYYNGYTNQSYQIKKSKVWGNWGIALGINVITYFILAKK